MRTNLVQVVLLLFSTYFSPSFSASIRLSDRLILSDFYDLYDGDGWAESTRVEDWKGLKGNTLDPCVDFESVGCDTSGAVVSLDMSWFELSFSASVGDGRSELEPVCGLDRLEVLVMSNNFLGGRLPPCLSSMVSLREIDLSWNRLEGVIPSDFFSEMENLVSLNLR